MVLAGDWKMGIRLVIFIAATLLATVKDPKPATAHILKIAHDVISLRPGADTHKSNYLIKLQIETTERIVLYNVGQSKDYIESFKEGTDVSYRVNGKDAFLTAPDGRKIKTTPCSVKDNATLCGEDIFPSME